jgi:nitrous-oxide reductase
MSSTDVDPETVVDEYEQQLEELLAEVEDPTPAKEGLDLGLPGLDRRDFMKAGMAVGAASGLAGCSSLQGPGSGDTPAGASAEHSVPPGEHDEYYGFWSGGHSGEVRVIGVPSMRQLIRIPVFQKDGALGYGHDEQTKQVLEEGGDIQSMAGHEWGDTHHPILSESGGDYDGKYLFINDKVSGRMARINLKYFETDAITDIPNMQACHGCSVQSPDTGYVYGVGEFRVPVPNDGTTVDDSEEYWSVFTALNPETMEVEWQVRVTGNLDNSDSGKDGEWAFATGYNKEEAFEIEGMTHDDRDYLKAFHIPTIETAIENGKAEEVNGVPVLDGRKGSSLNSGSDPIVKYVPTPKSPHGCDVEPQGRYVTASGKLSPTVTIVDIEKLGKVSDPADAIVGQPKVGLGPLHTTWDGRGHGYTTLFIDSQVAKWDIEKAVEAEKGSAEPVVGKVDVHYNPGHLQAAEAETTEPAGDWLVSLNKLSKDRFLPVGPIHPDNDQLLHIGKDDSSSKGGMELVADEPVHPEPHDCVIAHKDSINPNKVWDKGDYEGEKPFITEEDSTVERTGDESVHVKMSAKRSEYGLRDFTVKEGDEVTLTVTNIESSRDIIHGVAVPRYAINLSIAPQDTREATFTASEPGVYWLYCTYFCSALHLEMRSRMVVEPRS